VVLVEQNGALALDMADHSYVMKTAASCWKAGPETFRENSDIRELGTVRTSMIRVKISAAAAQPANGKPPLALSNEVRDPIRRCAR
jgi:hypothetical protein